MAGSAPQARGWLLLEHPGPWPVDAVAGSGIEPTVLRAAARRGGGGRRPHPAGPPAGSAGARCAAALDRWSRPGRATVADRGGRTRTCGPRRPPWPTAPTPTPGPRCRLTRSSWSAPTGCTTPAAPSAVARSPRRWPSTSRARCGSAAMSAVTASRPTWCCCPTASTTATSTRTSAVRAVRQHLAGSGGRAVAAGHGQRPAARPGRGGRRVRTPRAARARRGVGRSRCTRSARTTATARRPPSLLRVGRRPPGPGGGPRRPPAGRPADLPGRAGDPGHRVRDRVVRGRT